MENQPLITVQGAERLRRELEQLERTDRVEISAAIARARAHGDLSENAEYHAAKEKQGLVEARIRQLRHALAGARAIDPGKQENDGTVRFGMKVRLLKLDDECEMELQIVGEMEADVSAGRISAAAPVARALAGQSVGGVVSVSTPDGELEYEILAVAPPDATA